VLGFFSPHSPGLMYLVLSERTLVSFTLSADHQLPDEPAAMVKESRPQEDSAKIWMSALCSVCIFVFYFVCMYEQVSYVAPDGARQLRLCMFRVGIWEGQLSSI